MKPSLEEVLAYYDPIAARAPVEDHEWDFVMTAEDYKILRDALEWSETFAVQLAQAKAVLVKLDKTHAKTWEHDREDSPGFVSGNVNVNDVGCLIHIVRTMLDTVENHQ
jgi:hypothetical protein